MAPLYDALRQLNKKIRGTKPWENGYNEMTRLYDLRLKELENAAHKSMVDFKTLESISKELEQQYSSNHSLFDGWEDVLVPFLQIAGSFLPPPANLAANSLANSLTHNKSG